jgi:hypothetical protein
MRWIRRPFVLHAVLAVAVAGSVLVSARSGSAAAPAEGCTRDVLRTAAGAYYNALVAHDASRLSWAPSARVTENGTAVAPGQGFWKTAGAATFTRVSYDTDTCSVHSQAVMNDGTRPAIVGVRFKIAGAGSSEITESETITTHSGDYLVFSTNGLIRSDSARTDTRWTAAVPEAQRSTRQQLIDIADGYYSMFTSGTVDRTPYKTNCDRWENGVRTSAGNCVFGNASGTGDGKDNFISHRRYPFVDVENGVVVGYVLFGSYLDFHMFKVVDGHVRLVSALVGSAGHTSTGWE